MKCQHGCSGLVQTWSLLAGVASHAVGLRYMVMLLECA